MTLAKRLRELRERSGLSLEVLATKARISKTYLWELEKDESGEKKPSADVLLRLANALSTTIAVLMSLPTVKIQNSPVEIPAALLQLQERLRALGTVLTERDLRDLASTRFRGGQPRSVDDWYQLYSALVNTTRKKKS
jgi:transcriptional regulator with XRE-family HTH domain